MPRSKNKNDVVQDSDFGKKAVGVASSVMIGRLISLVLSGSAFIIVARILGPSTYGVFTIAIAFAGFIGTFGDAGVGVSLSKHIGQYIAKKDKKSIGKVLSNGYSIMLIFGIILSVVAFFLSGLIAQYVLGTSAYTYIVRIVSFTIILSIFFSALYSAIIGFGKGRYITIIILLQIAFQSIISIILAYLNFGALAPIIGIIIGYIVGITVSLFLIYSKFKIKLERPSFDGMLKLLNFSVPVSIYNGLRSLVNNLSPILLGLFATTMVVGNFGVALKTGSLFGLVIESLTASLLPMFASTLVIKNLDKKLSKFYNYAMYLTFMVMVPAMFYTTILYKQFSYTAFGASYSLAPYYIAIISIGTLFWIIATSTTMLLIGRNMVKAVLKYAVMISIMEFILLFTLVPLFKGYGLVAILYIVTPIVMSCLSVLTARKKLGVVLDTKKLLKIIIAGVISAGLLLPLVYPISNYELMLVVGAIEQILIYPPILALVGGANEKDLTILKKVSKNLFVVNKILELLANYSEYFIRIFKNPK